MKKDRYVSSPVKKKKELSVEEKIARIQERTAMYHLMLGVMQMPWFQKLMEKAIEEPEKEEGKKNVLPQHEKV